MLKRSVDVVLAGFLFAVTLPVLAIAAIVIKLDSEGPVIFHQARMGRGFRRFQLLKLRTMRFCGEGSAYTLGADSRITRVGRWLRWLKFDELPQLWNVLRGDMSIVGPRPIIVAETEKYDSDISHYYRVRPGITGLWQVSGRNDVSYAERVSMDSWYVRNWSLWHDIAIICKTVPVVLKRSGAY